MRFIFRAVNNLHELVACTTLKLKNGFSALPRVDNSTRIEPAIVFYIEWVRKNVSLLFDVGAHTGHFTTSVLQVLPKRTKIVLFEADPRHAPILNGLEKNQPRIIQVLLNAVYHTSGKTLKFLQCAGEASHIETSQHNDENTHHIAITTIALDDFISTSKLRPQLIKIDAEGSEFDIITGATKYIAKYRPIIIFEDWDLRASCLMQGLGYQLINTSTALAFEPASGNPSTCTLNLFAYHPANAKKYGITPLQRNPLISGILSDFSAPSAETSEFYNVFDFTSSKKKKILLELIFAQKLEGDMKIEYTVDGKTLGCYGGDAETIIKNYNSCPLHIGAHSNLRLHLYTQVPLDLTNNRLNVYIL